MADKTKEETWKSQMDDLIQSALHHASQGKDWQLFATCAQFAPNNQESYHFAVRIADVVFSLLQSVTLENDDAANTELTDSRSEIVDPLEWLADMFEHLVTIGAREWMIAVGTQMTEKLLARAATEEALESTTTYRFIALLSTLDTTPSALSSAMLARIQQHLSRQRVSSIQLLVDMSRFLGEFHAIQPSISNIDNDVVVEFLLATPRQKKTTNGTNSEAIRLRGFAFASIRASTTTP